MLTVARTLLGNPRLILVDEPTEGLAPLIVTEVLEMMAAVRDSGVTVLMVEQNFKASIRVADRFYIRARANVFEETRMPCLRPKKSGRNTWRYRSRDNAGAEADIRKEGRRGTETPAPKGILQMNRDGPLGQTTKEAFMRINWDSRGHVVIFVLALFRGGGGHHPNCGTEPLSGTSRHRRALPGRRVFPQRSSMRAAAAGQEGGGHPCRL
jgi:hypothetical protein